MILKGKWRIIELEAFDDDYPNLAEPACIEIDEQGLGEMAFGALTAALDCAYTKAASTSIGTVPMRANRSAARAGPNFGPTARSSAKFPGATATKQASKPMTAARTSRPTRIPPPIETTSTAAAFA